MFTGLIEEVSQILDIQKKSESMILKIFAEKVLEKTKIGDSISVDGVCTTVTESGEKYFAVDISPQTFSVTNLSNLKKGDFVNLERAMMVGARFGGHIVSGHVDFVSSFLKKEEKDGFFFLSFLIPQEKSKYFIDKGSVTINGISLTIAEKREKEIVVCIIPHTFENTNLKYLKTGQNVNIEIDMIAKYVENFVGSKDNKSNINEAFLRENGFYEI